METEWLWEDYEDAAKTISTDNPIEFHKAQLTAAVGQNNITNLNFLLDNGGGINLTDCRKNTLIHYAVQCDRLEILEVLLDVDGAPIDAEESLIEETALLLALRESKEALAIKLVEKGADINLVDTGGNSALLHSVCNNSLHISKLLIEKGADINCRNNDGVTPLFITCRNNWVESVCMFLYYGADVTIPTRVTGSTPFLVASSEVQDILFYFIFDGHKTPELLCTLTNAMVSDSPLLEKLFQNVCQVLYDKKELYFVSSRIPRMNPHYLQIFVERFEDATKDLIQHCDVLLTFSANMQPRFYTPEIICRGIGNLAFLVNSQLSSFIVSAINRWRKNHDYYTIGYFVRGFDSLNDTQLQHLMDITSQLLTQGVQINVFDVDSVYLKYGYCSLFKQMIVMDISKEGMWGRQKNLMPQLIYDVKMTIEEFFFKTQAYNLNSLNLVLEQFCHQKLKELCVELNDKMERQVKELPDVPLLVELARNAARQYIVDFYKIENFRQLKDTVEALPIPEKQKKILTYEEKLYV